MPWLDHLNTPVSGLWFTTNRTSLLSITKLLMHLLGSLHWFPSNIGRLVHRNSTLSSLTQFLFRSGKLWNLREEVVVNRELLNTTPRKTTISWLARRIISLQNWRSTVVVHHSMLQRHTVRFIRKFWKFRNSNYRGSFSPDTFSQCYYRVDLLFGNRILGTKK